MELPSPPAPSAAGVPGEARGGESPRTPGEGRWTLLKWLGRTFHGIALAVALAFLAVIVGIVYFLFDGSWQSILQFGAGFLASTSWDAVHNVYGASPAIAGTFITAGLALLIAVPIALGCALFMSEVAPRWLSRPLTYVVDLCAAVPSVVYGFWAFIVLVPIMRDSVQPWLDSIPGVGSGSASGATGFNILTATVVLAIMIIPTITAISREALRGVSRAHRESARSLGATRWETARLGVLREARGGIIAGIILGLGRALGETIAVAMVIGNIYLLPGTVFSPGTTLASWIVVNFNESTPGIERSAIIELALILLGITILVNIVARLMLRRWGGRESETTTHGDRIRARHPHGVPTLGPSPLTTTGPLAGPGASPGGWRQRVVANFPTRLRNRQFAQWAFVVLAGACVVAALVPFASVVYTAIQYGGAEVLRPSFYTSVPPLACNPSPAASCQTGGIGPQIQGTVIMLALGCLIAVPGGILGGIYLSEYGRGRFGRAVSFLADVMTGIPTIILGVFVFSVFLYFDHPGSLSALCGGVGLGVLMLPISIRASEEAFRSVSPALREAALAMGFPRHRVTVRIVLGSSKSSLVSGLLLATSRAAGDTAILFLCAGASSLWFQGLNYPTAAITPFIFNNFGSSYENLQAAAWGAALVLLAIMLIIGVGARLAVRSQHSGADTA